MCACFRSVPRGDRRPLCCCEALSDRIPEALSDAFAEAFKSRYPNLDITVKKTGSSDGAAALIDGRCDIAIMSRFMKDKEFKKAVDNEVFPVAHVVAMDGVCVVVHPSRDFAQRRFLQFLVTPTITVGKSY